MAVQATGSGGGRDPLRRRRWGVLAVVVISLVSGGGGLAASLLVRSPQQVIADTRPPQPSVVTAAAQVRVVARVVAASGRVAPKTTVTVPVGNLPGGVSAVVTAAEVRAGERIEPGQVIAELAGLPVIALPGAFPAYRDIMPGDTGKDVAQLQAALIDLGFSVSDSTGDFGTSTQAAVAQMFKDRGYAPATATTAAAAGNSRTGGSPAGSAGKSSKPQVWVPSAEVVYLPKFPAHVAQVNAPVGSVASGTLLTLSAGPLRVVACVPAEAAGLVRRGEAATINGAGNPVAGKISSVGPLGGGGSGSGPGGSSAAGSGSGPGGSSGAGEGTDSSNSSPTGPCGNQGTGSEPVVVAARGLPQRLDGQDVQVIITAASTRGKVLAVPVAAVRATAGGSTEVVEVLPGGRQVALPVRTGATGGGWVEVTPLGGGSLAAGDQVVVGQQ